MKMADNGLLDITLFSNFEIPSTKQFERIQWDNDDWNGLKYSNGNSYHGDISSDGKSRQGVGKLWNNTRNEFIEGNWQNDCLHSVIFAQFSIGQNEVIGNETSNFLRIYGTDNMLTCDSYAYVARIKIQTFNVENCNNFHSLYKTLETFIRIKEVLSDELFEQLVVVRKQFSDVLDVCVKSVSINPKNLKIMYALFHILSTYKKIQVQMNATQAYQNNSSILNRIKNWDDKGLSGEIRNIASEVLVVEKKYYTRNQQLPCRELLKPNNNDKDFRSDLYSWEKNFTHHVEQTVIYIQSDILSNIPTAQITFLPTLRYDIEKLAVHQTFHLNRNDIQLFCDLELSTLQQIETLRHEIYCQLRTFFKLYVASLWHSFIRQLMSIKLSNAEMKNLLWCKPVFLQLYKTFLDLLVQIFNIPQNTLQINSILMLNENTNLIVRALQNIENNSVNTNRELVNRLKFIVQLVNCFKPPVTTSKKFDYKLSLFVEVDKMKSVLQAVLRSSNDTYKIPNEVPEEYCIWLFYIHYSLTLFLNNISAIVSDKKQTVELKEFYNGVVLIFIEIITNEENGNKRPTLEQMRILATSFILFSCFASNNFIHNADENTIHHTNNKNLMKMQLYYIQHYIQNDATSNDVYGVSSLVDAFQVFWEQKNYLQIDLSELFSLDTNAMFRNYVSELNEEIYIVAKTAYELNLYQEKFVVWVRAFNELLKLLRSTRFPWYVKHITPSDFLLSMLEKVKADHSYLVKDVRNYIESFEEVEKHYLFEVICTLLRCIDRFLVNIVKLSEMWKSCNNALQASSDLTQAIARSFINFDEQANYEDYDSFCRACTQPFIHLVDVTIKSGTLSIKEFQTRVANLERFYTYTKELTVMSIENALSQCKKLSLENVSTHLCYDINTEILRTCYGVYITQFNDIISAYINNKKRSVNTVVQNYGQTFELRNVEEWDVPFKTKVIPTILAKLSAVWSILQSEDVLGQERIIKPHCIQILCVLRLLGVDNYTGVGVQSHLAQVLTGQGKSVVLALLAATLTVTGNKARIVCYNSYLAKRDEKDFSTFYKLFNINGKITYGTFQDMAEELLVVRQGKKSLTLRNCVQKFVLDSLPERTEYKDSKNINFVKTILLIDEVDVFFTQRFYGKSYLPCTVLRSEEIANIQMKIWHMVSEADSNTKTLYTEIKSAVQNYIREIVNKINDSNNLFYKFYYKSGALLSQNIDQMISNAIHLKFKYNTEKDYQINRYKLDEKDRIVYVSDNGTLVTNIYSGYYNAFNYFRLKGQDYNHQNFKNFGYIHISSGNISYALLPKEYDTILGVTGTLTTLNKTELDAIESYNITCASDMPSFFGRRKLKFHSTTDVSIIEDGEANWLNAILASVMRHVNEDRAVLVFFESEFMINKKEVRDAFMNHVGRMHTLTGNEAADIVEQSIDAAGVSRHVTVTTRFMGRGVDYKSTDSLVESKGGIHVIQTFFSDDIKEEIQIKGRTARLDHSGSYELILCRAHLQEADYKKTSNMQDITTYHDLCVLRNSRANTIADQTAKSIKEQAEKHEKSMNFFKTLQNYESNMRAQLLSDYPFVESN